MSAPKVIAEKEVGTITYELRHWPGDNKYVIYKWDSKLLSQGNIAHRVLEVGVFDSEKDAREFLETLDS